MVTPGSFCTRSSAVASRCVFTALARNSVVSAFWIAGEGESCTVSPPTGMATGVSASTPTSWFGRSTGMVMRSGA
jgi:hypothetical protein